MSEFTNDSEMPGDTAAPALEGQGWNRYQSYPVGVGFGNDIMHRHAATGNQIVYQNFLGERPWACSPVRLQEDCEPSTTESGRILVGHRIGVFYEKWGEYRYGTILDLDCDKGLAFVHFDNGRERSINLKLETWMLVNVPGHEVLRRTDVDSKERCMGPLESEIDPIMTGDDYVVFPSCGGRVPAYEVFIQVPECFRQEQVRVMCREDGRVKIISVDVDSYTEEIGDDSGQSLKRNEVEITLPGRIKTSSAKAVYSGMGQVYIHVNILGEDQ
jgi:hypothetical protein